MEWSTYPTDALFFINPPNTMIYNHTWQTFYWPKARSLPG